MTLAAIIAIVVAGWAVFTFNRLIRLRQLGDNAWSDIDVQLKRRHDLIPNVVAVVQGHAGYERATLEALVAARGRAVTDRKSTRLNSSHVKRSYAVFCLKKKKPRTRAAQTSADPLP